MCDVIRVRIAYKSFCYPFQADGEAQAATMLGEAISKNPGYLKLRKLKASREIARTVIFHTYFNLQNFNEEKSLG
jgi:hypothetical protein